MDRIKVSQSSCYCIGPDRPRSSSSRVGAFLLLAGWLVATAHDTAAPEWQWQWGSGSGGSVPLCATPQV
eukprot:scaffold3873_cov177-Ochromonas_danica.AAC.2